MATIKDVASKAGVSITTVSRVMNDRGPLSEATKKAVHDAMEELGYFPNDVARALGKNSLNIMGLIVPTIKHPFFGELVHACEDETYRRGYKLMVVASDYNEEKEKRCMDILRRNMVDGIFYASHFLSREFLEALRVPAVTLNNEFSGLPVIHSDDVQGGYMAARHLIGKGCKCMVHISGQQDLHLSADVRMTAFIKECERQGVACKVYSASEQMLWDMEYMPLINRIFMENPDMDGIFASSDIIAAQCIQMAGTLGYRIPEDIKIVGYDDICLSRLLYPPLTTVHQDIKGLAKTAMDTVEELIEGKQVPESQVVSVSFIERKTT